MTSIEVELEEALLRGAEALAASRGVSLSKLIEELLGNFLAATHPEPQSAWFRELVDLDQANVHSPSAEDLREEYATYLERKYGGLS